jgi:AbrB family looped-hinge helix DNA binding protein
LHDEETFGMKSKVTARGQVSIPVEIRKRFNIEPESKLEWIVEGSTIKVVPLPKDPLPAFRGRGSGRYSTEQLVEERREERRKEDDDERPR